MLNYRRNKIEVAFHHQTINYTLDKNSGPSFKNETLLRELSGYCTLSITFQSTVDFFTSFLITIASPLHIV